MMGTMDNLQAEERLEAFDAASLAQASAWGNNSKTKQSIRKLTRRAFPQETPPDGT